MNISYSAALAGGRKSNPLTFVLSRWGEEIRRCAFLKFRPCTFEL
jgi:hypothetical protein